MSTIRPDGTKTVLPRTGRDQFWRVLEVHYAGSDRERWQNLAMLALRESADWPLARIGDVFDAPPNEVARRLERIKQELRLRFQPARSAPAAETTVNE